MQSTALSITLCCSLCLAVGARAQDAAAPSPDASEAASPADVEAKVRRLVAPLIENDAMVGCVVGVVTPGDDGQPRTQVFGFGETERGDGRTPDGKTVYEIGSITKVFTGSLLADMVERGEARLDAPLQEFVPEGVEVPVAEDQPITLQDLATHSSGLPRLPSNMEPDARDPYADYDEARLYEFLGKHKLRRAPGEYEYSNYAMGLLGHVLAARAGKSYEELVTERIIAPLGMNDTSIHLSESQSDRLAPAYTGELSPGDNWSFDAVAAAGALRSTCDDLLLLAKAALAEEPPTDDARSAWLAVHAAMVKRFGEEGELGVGLGWHVARDNVSRLHAGQTGGYSSFLGVYPPKQIGVVVLTNAGTGKTGPLGEKIMQSLLGMEVEPVATRKVADVPPEVLASYEGNYALSLLAVLSINVEEDKLMAQLTGQDKFQLFPESETEFFYKIVDAQITFEKNEEGKVTRLILHQNGLDLPAMRIPEQEAEE